MPSATVTPGARSRRQELLAALPTAEVLQERGEAIARRLMAARPIFRLFPVRCSDAARLTWRDEYGTFQERTPVSYGEYLPLDSPRPADLPRQVERMVELLVQRRVDRIEYALWTELLAQGAPVPSGLFDWRGGTALLNRATLSRLGPYRGVAVAGEDVASLVAYDEGYLDDEGRFRPFVPTGKVVVAAASCNGALVGDYAITRNACRPGVTPGPWLSIRVRPARGSAPVRLEIHDSHNGGPRLFYASAIAVLDVADAR